MISRRTGIWLLLAFTLIVGAAAFLTPRFDLPPSYHDFADTRVWLGIPHFGDVVSNLLFAIAGLWGLLWLSREPSRVKFVDPRERWPYLVLFFGLLLTAFGSAYYHLAPDDARLVWDRLPMTMIFMPLAAAVIAERISVRAGLWLLPVLTAVGIASVLVWRVSVLHGTRRFALLFRGTGVRGADFAGCVVAAAAVHAWLRLSSCFFPLRSGQNHGTRRPSNFLVRAHCERAHSETPGSGRRGILDFKDAAEETAHPESVKTQDQETRTRVELQKLARSRCDPQTI